MGGSLLSEGSLDESPELDVAETSRPGWQHDGGPEGIRIGDLNALRSLGVRELHGEEGVDRAEWAQQEVFHDVETFSPAEPIEVFDDDVEHV
jgi:hypothetical protein